MNLYLFFSIIISLSFGTPAFALNLITFKRVKDRTLLYLLIYFSTYTFLLYLSMFIQYIAVYNISFFHRNIIFIDNIYSFINYCQLSTVVLLAHQLFNIKLKKIRNIIFISILWIVYIIKNIFFRDILFTQYVKGDELNFLTLFPLIVFLYFIFNGIYNTNKIIDIKDKKITIKLVILYIWALLLVLAYYLGLTVVYILQPVAYVALGFIIIQHILKYYVHCKQYKINIKSNEIGTEAKKILNQWDLTNREKDVLFLILEGYSNKIISEKLFISISTVKYHTKNIYSKTKLENRYGLLSIFQGIK